MSGRKYVGDVGKPLSPGEILNTEKQIPGYVYDAFNECIAAAIRSGGTGYFTRHFLVSMLIQKAPLGEFFYHDLEAAAKDYEDHGWKVTFDMTNSSEPIGFTFTPRPE